MEKSRRLNNAKYKDIEILFQGYLDNELDQEDIIKVEEYLNENEEAKKVFEDLKKIKNF